MYNIDEIIKKMKTLNMIDDPEEAHMIADELLCKVLNELDFNQLVKAFDDVNKWYA